jgi:hypothetical protein
MAKITSNEYVKIAWVLDANMTPAQAAAPTVAILTAGTTVDLSPAISWQDFALGATDSDDVEDRGITDPGNAVTRGFANFEGTLSFFRDKSPNDSTSDFVKAWQTFKVPRTYGYLVMRVAEKKWDAAWAAGDRVSVFRFVADAVVDDTEGDDAVKFTVTFLPQGLLYPYTMVSGAGVITGVPTTNTLTIGTTKPLAPILSTKSIRATATYTSSDTTKVKVTPNGFITGVAAGTSTITVSHPAATAPITQTVTVS